jgi:hypothetical protein
MKRPSLAKKFGGEENIPAVQLLTQLVNEANRNGRFDNDRGGLVDLPRLVGNGANAGVIEPVGGES